MPTLLAVMLGVPALGVLAAALLINAEDPVRTLARAIVTTTTAAALATARANLRALAPAPCAVRDAL